MMNDAKVEIIDNDYDGIKDISKSRGFLSTSIKKLFDNKEKIEELLYKSQEFIELIKSTVPEDSYKAILTNEQKKKLKDGSLQLMSSSDGSLLANLIDPNTKKIVSKINLEKVKITPDIDNSIVSYNYQLQMAEIAKEIEDVKAAVEEVRKGLENDRLALAYSCEQKLIQAMEIKDSDARKSALLKIAHSSEDCRNQLMLSQQEKLKIIDNRPEDLIGKVKDSYLTRVNMDNVIAELSLNMSAFNIASYAEVMAYQEMGEEKSAEKALQYYGEFINNNYLNNIELLERLDSLDSSKEKYWTKRLPNIYNNIKELDKIKDIKLLEGEK